MNPVKILVLAKFVILLCISSCSGLYDESIKPMQEVPKELADSYLNAFIKVDGINETDFYKDCYINSIIDETSVSDMSMELQSNINPKVQTFFLTNEGDKIYLITRISDTKNNKKIVFSVENTALAFVTLHPLFAHIDDIAYDILEETILQSKNFPKVRTEINNIIYQKKDLYSSNNTELLEACGLLLEELLLFANYKPETEITRAITNEVGYYPFKLNSRGNRLELQVFGLNPNYYGIASHANGSEERLIVQSHEDFGFLAGLESIWNLLNQKGWDANQYGEIESYTFPAEGECQFHFSCNTKENQVDLLARLLSSALDILGIVPNESLPESVLDIYNDYSIIAQEVNNASYKLGTITFPFYEIIENIIIDKVIKAASDLIDASIEQSFNNEINVYEKLKTTTKDKALLNAYNNRISRLEKSKVLYKKAMNAYSFIKAIGNIAARIGAVHMATDPVDFKLCYYNNEIRNCSQIRKYKGDNQTGTYGAELEDSIRVMVNINMESLSDYLVKFEVIKGGGTVGGSNSSIEYVDIKDYIASINWILGSDSEEQIVRASLCEKSSTEEVCKPVEFKAKAEEELLSIYIENIEYEESPSYRSFNSIVTFEPTITVMIDETEKLENFCDWGLVIYEEDESGMHQEIERIKVGENYNIIDLTRKFELKKSEMIIDYTNFIAKNDNKYSIGTYVKYEKNGRTFDSDVLVPIELVYNRKPEIKFTSIKLTRNSFISSNGDLGYRDHFGSQCFFSGTLFFKGTISFYCKSTYNGSIWGPNNRTVYNDNYNDVDSIYGHAYWECPKTGQECYAEAILVNEQTIRSTNSIIISNSFPCSYYIK